MALSICSLATVASAAPASVALAALASVALPALASVALPALASVALPALASVALPALPGNVERMHEAVYCIFAQLMLPLQSQLRSQEMLTVK